MSVVALGGVRDVCVRYGLRSVLSDVLFLDVRCVYVYTQGNNTYTHKAGQPQSTHTDGILHTSIVHIAHKQHDTQQSEGILATQWG